MRKKFQKTAKVFFLFEMDSDLQHVLLAKKDTYWQYLNKFEHDLKSFIFFPYEKKMMDENFLFNIIFQFQ